MREDLAIQYVTTFVHAMYAQASTAVNEDDIVNGLGITRPRAQAWINKALNSGQLIRYEVCGAFGRRAMVRSTRRPERYKEWQYRFYTDTECMRINIHKPEYERLEPGRAALRALVAQ